MKSNIFLGCMRQPKTPTKPIFYGKHGYNLQNVKTPNVTYDLKVVDLYKIMGLEPEALDLGDQGAVIDVDLDLQLQARVIEYEEDLINRRKRPIGIR